MKPVCLLLCFLLSVLSGCTFLPGLENASPDVVSTFQTPTPLVVTKWNTRYLTFSINVHEFQHPQESAGLIRKLLDIHEKYNIPVDIFLTGAMVTKFEKDAPDLFERLKNSPVAIVSYHIRPPVPYYYQYDWMGLGKMTPEQQRLIIYEYETHELDLKTGLATSQPGGYAHLTEIMGYPPPIVGALSDAGVSRAVDEVFLNLGAQMVVVHNRPVDPGEQRNGLFIRPEHFDLKLYEYYGKDAEEILRTAYQEGCQENLPDSTCVVGVKMHDNDFFSTRASVRLIFDGKKSPLWDLNQTPALMPSGRQAGMWSLYENMVKYAAASRNEITVLNAPGLLNLARQGR